MVERQPIADAPAAIMTHEREMDVTECLHRLDHRLCHGALRIGPVIVGRRRDRRPAIARQTKENDGAVAGDLGGDPVPHDLRLRKTVQQEDRRPRPGRAGEQAAGTRVEPMGRKSGKKVVADGHRGCIARIKGPRKGGGSPTVSAEGALPPKGVRSYQTLLMGKISDDTTYNPW